jgi:esterase/lipase
MRISTKFIVISFLSLVCASLLIVLGVGSALSAPNNVKIGKIPIGLNVEQIKFKSKNGNTLSGWFVPGDDKHGGILLMHGVHSNRKEMIQRAIFLNQSGYSVLLFDFQAHGESEGENITFGYLEAQDAEAAYNYLMNHIKKKSVGVIGVSLGGASALLGNVANKSNALIIEAVYPTFTEAVKNRMTMRIGKIGHYLSSLLILQIEPRLGFNPEILKPINHLSELNTPLFIIAGTNDTHTTLSESKRMYNVASEPKEIWLVKDAEHQNFHQYLPLVYQEKVLGFFNKYL